MGVSNLAFLTLIFVGCFAGRLPVYSDQNNGAKNENFFFGGKKWVVLVAGSSGWNNYRHQADICHAYHIVRKNGIPEENIITMMVDDIAYNPRNPTPGKIINKPNGNNVYEGVVIDYSGTHVNSTNFLKIITGDKKAMRSIGTGKVVQGGSRDKIFINFVGHGSNGYLSFPNDNLYADQLNDTFKIMRGNSTYKKILLYVEASNSGSMFDGILSGETNILAVTASGPRENSYACYCSSWQCGSYKTCLGDLFSVTWMEKMDAMALECPGKKSTVFKVFEEIRTSVNQSNVMIYGDLDSAANVMLSEFIGYRECSLKITYRTVEPVLKIDDKKMTDATVLFPNRLAVDHSTDLEIQNSVDETRPNNEMRSIIDKVFQDIYSMVVKARPGINDIEELDQTSRQKRRLDAFPCYRSILNEITKSCFSLPQNPYTLDGLMIFENLCIADKHIHQMVGSYIVESCSNIPKYIIGVH